MRGEGREMWFSKLKKKKWNFRADAKGLSFVGIFCGQLLFSAYKSFSQFRSNDENCNAFSVFFFIIQKQGNFFFFF